MRIALAHNLRLSQSEEEAAFDTPETIDALTGALERLGHRVERLDVASAASRIIGRLEAFEPDLVFNTVTGRRGRRREAFLPALFEEISLPYTGADAYALLVTLDKHTAKTLLAQRGVLCPRGQFVRRAEELRAEHLRFPVLVKPNFESAGEGISSELVVDEAARLPVLVAALLERYPAGVLVEEFVPGRDVSVPFLSGASPETKGLLAPVEHVVSELVRAGRRDVVLDFKLRSQPGAVSCVPADLPRDVRARLMKAASVVASTFDLKDCAQIDFRLGDDGQPHFIEVNAIPSLERNAALFVAAAHEGLSFDSVVRRIVDGAAQRSGLDPRKRRTPRRPLRVGFSYNVKRVKPQVDGAMDHEAEYDSPQTLQSIRDAIASHGHEVVDLEATGDLPTLLTTTHVDVVFNIAEGFKGRNRESQVPALLELLDIPYSGSDPATLAIALDKSLAKRVVRQAGVLTPDFLLMHTGRERLPKELQRFPLIVKPNAEGSSKGVHSASVVRSEAELREEARRVIERYEQPALVEQYIAGREFTVGLLGERRPRVLPIMEVVFLDKSEPTPVYSFAHKQDWSDRVRYDAPAKVEPAMGEAIRRAARAAFSALNCRDVARIDFRVDAQGRVFFIECNPLPGLTPGWSDLVLISQAEGMEYRRLIGEILAPAIRRYEKRERARRRTERERPPA